MSAALPCCNDIEHRDLSATRCSGSMALTRRALEYVCDTCGGRCGSLAHPRHPEPVPVPQHRLVTTLEHGGTRHFCLDCHATKTGQRKPEPPCAGGDQ